jgi:hypothetical protein
LGAEHLTWITQLGPLARGLLYLAYLIGFAVLANAIYDLVKYALKSND